MIDGREVHPFQQPRIENRNERVEEDASHQIYDLNLVHLLLLSKDNCTTDITNILHHLTNRFEAPYTFLFVNKRAWYHMMDWNRPNHGSPFFQGLISPMWSHIMADRSSKYCSSSVFLRASTLSPRCCVLTHLALGSDRTQTLRTDQILLVISIALKYRSLNLLIYMPTYLMLIYQTPER